MSLLITASVSDWSTGHRCCHPAPVVQLSERPRHNQLPRRPPGVVFFSCRQNHARPTQHDAPLLDVCVAVLCRVETGCVIYVAFCVCVLCPFPCAFLTHPYLLLE